MLEGDDDDKDSETEDDKGKINTNDQLQAYMKLLESAQQHVKSEQKANAWQMDPNTLLQGLLLANVGGFAGLGQFPSLFQSSSKEELPEFLRKLLTQPQELKSEGQKEDHNGGGSGPNPLTMLNLFQQQYGNKHPAHPHSSGTPDIEMDGSDDSTINSSILKVPSVQKSLFPGTSSSSAHSRNGDAHSTPSTSPQIPSTSPNMNHLGMRSPPMMHRHRSESSSPPTANFNLHDVIRQSISKNFQTNLLEDKHNIPLSIDPMDPFQKRPSISVMKNIGGTDISRFGSNPNITQHHPQQLSPNTGTGGKGTRPKRGKYRNYDRDSLVEAVKAVQRGEMSVHRAGSYYGVPHSTLEYKVKERHLMRPRKREPKPQPLDTSSTTSTSAKPDISGLRAMDKSKVMPSIKQPLKPPYGATNGLKMPPFLDPSMAAQLQFSSQLFWQHGNFPTMPGLDFARGSGQNSGPFPPNSAENFFTQQMLQKLKEDQQQFQQPPVNGHQNNSGKSDTIFDAIGTNGSSSFLDGIIRQSLDKKPSDLVQGNIFEQLLKKTQSSMMNSDDNGYAPTSPSKKRIGSPIDFTQDIKRERSSPPPNDNDSEFIQPHVTIKEELNGSSKNDLSDTNS